MAKKISVDVQALYAVIEAQEKAIKALQETIDGLRNTGASQLVFPPAPPSPSVPYVPYQPSYIDRDTWPYPTTICSEAY